MECPECQESYTGNVWVCSECGARIEGGVVFVTGISGSDADRILKEVIGVAKSSDHEHPVSLHDVGALMKKQARKHDPTVVWDKILDASPRYLRLLRALAFQEIQFEIERNYTHLHIIDLHLSFRWKVYLTKGFEPYIIRGFLPHVRGFINVIEDLDLIQGRLAQTSWGEREILELLIWRDEELLLTDMFAGICGGVDCFAVASAEPPMTIERLIWHPEMKKVYLSFPITGILTDEEANEEVKNFRDKIRDFLVVFDPRACQDYDKTYERAEMKALRKEVGETTTERDYRFIDQSDAVVVYYPRKVPSKGVDAEMRHAFETGKPIFLYCPETLEYGPFQPPADHVCQDPEEYIQLLRKELGSNKEGKDV